MNNNRKIPIIEFVRMDIINVGWRPIRLRLVKGATKIDKILCDDMVSGHLPKTNDFRDANWVKNKMPKIQSAVEADYYTHIALDTKRIYHLDVDWIETKSYTPEAKAWVAHLINDMKCPYYRSSSKPKGKHILFTMDEEIFNDTHKLDRSDMGKTYEDLEILAGTWGWAKKDTVIENWNGHLPHLTLANYKQIIRFNTPKSSIKRKLKIKARVNTQPPEQPDDTHFFKKMDLIKLEYLDDYATWFRILLSIKSYGLLEENEAYKIAKWISAKSAKYSLDDFNSKWANIQPTTNISIGTAIHYSKISDGVKYREIRLTEMETEDLDFLDSDATLAEIYLKDNSKDVVLKYGKHLYTFISTSGDEGRWVRDENKNTLKYNVGKYLSDLFTDLHTKVNSAEEVDANKCERIYKLTAKIKNVAKINSVVEKILHNISVINYDKIEFDNDGYLLAFNNKVYDLKTHNWVNCVRDNYILTTTGYDWEDPTDEQMERIRKLFEDVFEDDEIRCEFIHYLATCLYGIAVEKFIVANGDGGNGKGVMSELTAEAIGNYYYSGNNAVLLQPIKNGGNPEIANMEGKRMVVYREPSEYKKLDLSVIKELTGGAEIPARKLFSNDTKVNLSATHILEVNKRLGLNGDTGNSIVRRLRDIPFKTEFTNDEEAIADKNLNYVKRADTYYKSDTFKGSHKFALIKYLIDYCVYWESCEDNPDNKNVCEMFFESDEITERTQQYIENNDAVLVFLNSKFIETKDTENDFFKIADFYMCFKDDDFYTNLSKADRNGAYSKKAIVEYFKSKAKLRKYYKAREDRTAEKWNGKDGYGKNLKNIIKGWRMRNDDEMEAASDDDADEELDFINLTD